MNQKKLLVKLENAGVQRMSKWLVKGISFEIMVSSLENLAKGSAHNRSSNTKTIILLTNGITRRRGDLTVQETLAASCQENTSQCSPDSNASLRKTSLARGRSYCFGGICVHCEPNNHCLAYTADQPSTTI